MSNQLVPQDLVEGPLSKDFADVTAGAEYLPRLQLYGSKSDAVAEGKIGQGRYGLVKDTEITDLGDEINVIVVSWRPKAVDVGGDAPLIIHNAGDALFNEIKKKSFVRDSGCMYGPEFLVWIPSAGTFATYHMNSKTARREAKKMEPLLGCSATFKCKLIDPPNSRHKWHGPVILPCSTPVEAPPEAETRRQWSLFQNPPEPTVELAEGGEDTDERAR